MGVFNYYARRDRISIVSSEEGIAKLATPSSGAYLLINDTNLKDVKPLQDNRDVVVEQRIGERKWYLLRLPRLAS